MKKTFNNPLMHSHTHEHREPLHEHREPLHAENDADVSDTNIKKSCYWHIRQEEKIDNSSFSSLEARCHVL
jgi:hypothetical protein